MGNPNNNGVLFFLLMFLTLSTEVHSLSKMEESIARVEESYSHLKQEIQVLKKITTEVSNKVVGFGDAFSYKNPCWFNAYKNLNSSCSDILGADEKRSSFAWHLSDCFQTDSGRNPFPYCKVESKMVDCLRKLNINDHKIYLEFYLETHSICHQLQSKGFKLFVERLVKDLKDTALSIEKKLETMKEKTDTLVHNLNQTQESITSIDERTQKIGATLMNMLGIIMKHTEKLNEQASAIAFSYVELLKRQSLIKEKMKEKMEESIAIEEEFYSYLTQEIEVLQKKTTEVGKKLGY